VHERGNVPAWTQRTALLPLFLVGAKPVPERVFTIVKQYQEMEAAGYFTGVTTAIDVPVEHARFKAAPAAPAAVRRFSVSPRRASMTGRKQSAATVNATAAATAAAAAAAAAVGAAARKSYTGVPAVA
jgi:hypothetical protein